MNEPSGSLQAMMDQGFDHLQVGRFEDAIDAFTACLAVYPEAAKAALGPDGNGLPAAAGRH